MRLCMFGRKGSKCSFLFFPFQIQYDVVLKIFAYHILVSAKAIPQNMWNDCQKQRFFLFLFFCLLPCSGKNIIYSLLWVVILLLILQRCNHCNRFGASVVCQIPRCGKTYHYPCAASSGSFQVCLIPWVSGKDWSDFQRVVILWLSLELLVDTCNWTLTQLLKSTLHCHVDWRFCKQKNVDIKLYKNCFRAIETNQDLI